MMLALAVQGLEKLVPSGGNPCLSVCDLAHGGNPASSECGLCCRTVRHEIPWHCDDEDQAAPSCKGPWRARWWDIMSKENFMHPCAACCGDCSTGVGGCGPCVRGRDNCQCGDCHLEGDESISCDSENATCVCPHAHQKESIGKFFGTLLLIIALFVVGSFVFTGVVVVLVQCYRRRRSSNTTAASNSSG